ncbi:HAD family hydrolase [Massilia sp. GCM10023247]|uniref:hypothetical protein n=1 Tax=Massilia sp. GCM10023247 TaxID=3252643 RepID=UPI00360857E9
MKTICSSDADAQRNAYNAAFHELGLSWYWDAGQYARAASGNDDRTGLRKYLAEHQPHLLSAHDADFLVEAILATKERCHAKLSAAGRNPGAFINWREIQQRQIGV